MKNKYLYIAMMAASLVTVSCKKTFTDRPALDATTVDNYYNTAEEVRSLTSTLYGLPWSGFENRAMDCIGDELAGNEFTGSGNTDDYPFQNFTISSNAVRLADAWKMFYKVGGWTSEYINALNLKISKGGNPTFINPAIAECHFFRGVVYFYIARIWGDAPIVTNPGKTILNGDFMIPRYLKADVFRFALEELKLAEAGLPDTDPVKGRLTKYAAKGMMAKLYLYNKDYANAKIKAQEVINSQKYKLVDDFAGMFNSSKNNNNDESIFAVQHQLSGNPWGTASQKQCDRGPGNLATTDANMWELYIPTVDVVAAFESGDTRRKGSIMEHGWSFPSWKPTKSGNAAYNTFMSNGYKYDTLQPVADGGQMNETRANIAKYVVGPGAAYGGDTVIGMNTGINTMLLRYADVLLIYAEAILGTGASTSDVEALKAFNLVRARAGLMPKTVITNDDILHERRMEFAFEGDYWFDIQRQGFAKAKAIIQAQNRGTKMYPKYITITPEMLYLPIPAAEVAQDPELAKPAVPYY